MALSKIDAANFLTGTIPSTNVANASLSSVTALPAGVGGKVLQVVTAGSNTSNQATSSSTYVSAGSAATITPSSSSNKIFAIVSYDSDVNVQNTVHFVTLYRGSTNVGLVTSADSNNTALARVHDVSAGRYLFRQVLQVLDTPNTTSATTYTLYHKVSQGSDARIRNDLMRAQITLMEVSA